MRKFRNVVEFPFKYTGQATALALVSGSGEQSKPNLRA